MSDDILWDKAGRPGSIDNKESNTSESLSQTNGLNVFQEGFDSIFEKDKMEKTIIISGRTNKTTTLKEMLENKLVEEFAIIELKKVKQMILERQGLTCDCNCNHCGWFPCTDTDVARTVKKDIKIIDKEISRLKGENNE